MATGSEPTAQYRLPVTKERVFRAAIVVADAGGIESLTMRKVADELDVEPMSLYYHVANKAAILDGVVETLVGDIEDALGRLDPLPDTTDWRTALRRRILTARDVMLRHRWAPALFESRTDVGPAMMRYYDGVLGHLRQGKFSFDLAHHALHVLGSRVLGFTQELFESEGEGADEEEHGRAREDGRSASQHHPDDAGDRPPRRRRPGFDDSASATTRSSSSSRSTL